MRGNDAKTQDSNLKLFQAICVYACIMFKNKVNLAWLRSLHVHFHDATEIDLVALSNTMNPKYFMG
jgi:hypothetical protein